MTRQALRRFLQEWFCGCGSPSDACRALTELLGLHPLYENRESFERLVPDEGMRYLLLYTLDHFDLTEHGGSIGGGWLTEKGQAVWAALKIEEADGFEALTEQACVHGYSTESAEGDHNCMGSTEPESLIHNHYDGESGEAV